MLEECRIECPYCGEAFTTLVDCSVGDQSYSEDCRVCCRPIDLRVHLAEDGSLAAVEVFRDDE